MGVFVREQEHPAREALFEYAEQLEAGHAAFGSDVAAHVRDCTVCAGEVRTMRRSIAFTEGVKTLEPTEALQASVILAMKSQRFDDKRQARRRMAKSAAFAAGFTLLFSMVVQSSGVYLREDVVRIGQASKNAPAPLTIESLTQDSPEERLLEPALASANWQPASAWEQAQQRALQAMDADIDEALAALQSNPALVRAGSIVQSNRELKRQTLKNLYAERNL
jgi:hypothetical protein